MSSQLCCTGALLYGRCSPSCRHAKPRPGWLARMRAWWREGGRAPSRHDDTDPCCAWHWGSEPMGECAVCRSEVQR